MPDGNRPKTPLKVADENDSSHQPEPSALRNYLQNESTYHLDRFITQLRREKQKHEDNYQKLCDAVLSRLKSSTTPGFKHGTPTHNFGQVELTVLDQWAEEIGLSSAPPPAPESAARGVTPSDVRLVELQEIFWTDVTLWELIVADAEGRCISDYLRNSYSLEVKAIPPVVWREMVRDPRKREQLFELIGVRFSCQLDPKICRDLDEKLPPELMGKFIWEYLYEPKCNHRYRLACQGLSPEALVYLRKAASALVHDILWCQQNPGIIPPRSAPQPSHRQKEVERAREIEKMVGQLLADPALSDLDLARTTKGISDSLRKMAREARRLVELREAREVHRYAEKRNGRTVGRKPTKTRT